MTWRGLVGDVGGTNGRFALVEGGEITKTQHWPTAELPCLSDVWTGLGGEALPDRVCVAVAAPVKGPRVRLTNAQNVVDVTVLDVARSRLVNDLEAAAAGLDRCDPQHHHTLIAGTKKPERPRLVVGLGTGMGVAIQLPDGTVLPGEGGHAPLSAADPEVRDVALRVGSALGRPVEWEDLLCGRGLGRLMLASMLQEGLIDGISDSDLADSGALDGFAARASTSAHPAAVRARRWHAATLGDALRGLALIVAAGEVALCGGVSGHLHQALAGPTLAAHFHAPGPVSHVLTDVPVVLCSDPSLALQGCVALS